MATKERKSSQSTRSSAAMSRETQSSGFNSYLRVFGYADSKSWLLFAVALIAAIGAGVPLPLMDLVFGQFVTAFNDFATGSSSPSQYMSTVTEYTLYFIYLFVAKFALVYIHTVCVSIAAIRVTKALRIDFLKTMLRQEIAFFDSKDSGSPSVKVTTTANLVNQGISEKLSLTIQGLSTFVTAFILAFAVQWKLTLITISIVPTILVVTAISVGIDAKQDGKILSIYSQAGLLAEEVFASITTVHALWLQPVMRGRYDSLLAEAEKVGMRKSPNWAVLFSVEFFCIYSGYGLAFWQGIRMYANREIEEPGKVVTVIFAVIVAATALTQLAPQFLQVSKAISAAGELFETIDRVSNIDALSEDGHVPTHCTGDIEVQKLEFAYPARPDEMILRGLNLKIPAGKTTALVGASGSGKSTIIGLLERWYEQSAGSLLLDGVDIRELNIQWLRTHVRLVQQEPVLFNGTIFENVAHGLIGTPLAELPDDQKRELVERACRDAFAHDFVMTFPKQYDTLVGERARMLSGGQKQRIAIARSIISDPPILLLDEATSALDPKAERIVQQALDNVSSTRTTLVIAHKLSTIQRADSIAVMAAGRVIEQGTHRELLSQGGAYSRLVKAQDLGSSQQEDDNSDEDEGDTDPKVTLTRTKSEVVVPDEDSDLSEATAGNPFNYSLLYCVWKLLREQRRLWPHFFVVAIGCVAGGAIFPAQAYMFAQTFEVFQLEGSDATERGDFWALMFFVVAIGTLVVYGALGWLCNTISQVLAREYRQELFTSVIHQNMAFFDVDNNATGALVSRLSNCATNLQELLQMNVALILINVVNVVSSSIFGIAFGWKLGLVCVFGALPPLILSGYIRIRLEFRLDDATSARFASSAAVAAEAVSAIRTVASLTLERSVLQMYQDRLADVATKSTKALLWTMVWYSLSQSINFLAMALGFWYGSKLVSTGEYTTTQFYAIFIAVIFGGEAAAAFFQYTTSLTKAQTAANLMFWLRSTANDLEPDSAPPSDDNNEKTSPEPAGVDFDALTFAYPSRPNTSILKSIDVNIPPGSFAAFVGPSGCGKSTTLALLERFYDPSSGAILVNDTPITERSPRQHRRRLALVQQEPTLYQGSIRDNIALGTAEHTSATEAQVQTACRQANIHDFVSSLPEGLDTSVGGRGSQLSGGQRQRIAIARALIRDPRILVLDEATSALDTESERVVQGALMAAAGDGSRTTVAVAHRLSTIKHADCIFVFEAGRIVEAGTHAELVRKGGRYFAMCQSQALDQ